MVARVATIGNKLVTVHKFFWAINYGLQLQ